MLGLDVVAIQNHILSMPYKNDAELEFWVDNEALYRMCKSHLGIETPSFTDVNKLIAEHASSLTSTRRFGGTSNFSFTELLGNVKPYPRLNYFSPMRPQPQAVQDRFELADSVVNLFDSANHMLTIFGGTEEKKAREEQI